VLVGLAFWRTRLLTTCGITRCETLFSENGKAPDSEGYQLAQSLMEK
jgi:hypothetical protein